MSDRTDIEWCDATWSPTSGCSRVSAGCDNCYAMHMARRFDKPGFWGYGLTRVDSKGKVDWSGVVREMPERLRIPLRWRKSRRIFVDSTSDLFHPSVSNEYIAAVFGVMAACPQHTFIVCTKRAKRMREWFAWMADERHDGETCDPVERMYQARGKEWHWPDEEPSWPLPNVWLLVSTEDQETFDERVPELLRCPAVVRGVSAEPLLGPIDVTMLHSVWDKHGEPSGPRPGIQWVIVGGESGHLARECDLAWVRRIRNDCANAGVPLFVKQLGSAPIQNWVVARNHGSLEALRHPKGGEPSEWPDDLRIRQFPEVKND